MAMSIRFSSLAACSGLLTVSSVRIVDAGHVHEEENLLSPRTAASSPRVAMMAPAHGEPGTSGQDKSTAPGETARTISKACRRRRPLTT